MSALDAALLSALRASPVHLPAAELAGMLRCEHGAVLRSIAEFREAGFEFDERPGLGFRLLATPDRIIADELRSRLGATRFIREIVVFAETDSTNQRAIDLGQSGAAGGVAIFAERQSRGRGRFGRHWDSALHKGLWFSVLMRPDLPLQHWSRLTTWAAVIVADAVEEETGVRVGIKWPNDLEVEGRKVAGMLIETNPDSAGAHFAVVGVGLNVNHTPEEFPAELRERATSLRIVRGEPVDRPALAAAILRTMDSRLQELHDGFENLVAAALSRSTLIGENVVIESGGTRICGIAEDLAEDGRLLVKLPEGTTEAIGAGEATVIRRR